MEAALAASTCSCDVGWLSANSLDRAGSLGRPCVLLASVMVKSSEEDVEKLKNFFEYSGERVLLQLAARHDREGGAIMCKCTDQGERSCTRSKT